MTIVEQGTGNGGLSNIVTTIKLHSLYNLKCGQSHIKSWELSINSQRIKFHQMRRWYKNTEGVALIAKKNKPYTEVFNHNKAQSNQSIRNNQ